MLDFKNILENEVSLDPKDWDDMTKLSLQMVKDMFQFLQNIDDLPVWEKANLEVKEKLRLPINDLPDSPENIYQQFLNNILPYTKRNIHPRHWAWVEGTGTPFTMMGDMLASGLNPNCNNADHSAMYVEEEVIEWLKKALNYPDTASGTLVSGTSLATLTGLLVARNTYTNHTVRKSGVSSLPSQLVLYTSVEAHICVEKSADIMGLGSKFVRKIPVDDQYQMSMPDLIQAITADRNDGLTPFCIVATVGTIRTGAIDPLDDILGLCKKENLWFHVDGAFGALAKLVPEYKRTLKSIEEADSIGFDLHKWMSVPYGVGCLLVKNKDEHRKSFAMDADYLVPHERGLASGPDPLSNYGIEMSRGFKSLKIWMTIKEHGVDKFSNIIRQNIAQAFYLEDLVLKSQHLELIAKVTLNIVCFRYNPNNGLDNEKINLLNKEILMQLHEKGVASPSFTMLDGKYALRVANVNHRSRISDFDMLVREVVKLGNSIINSKNNFI